MRKVSKKICPCNILGFLSRPTGIWSWCKTQTFLLFLCIFTLGPHSVPLIGNLTLALSGVSHPCFPELCLSSGIFHGVKTWDFQGVGKGVIGWRSTGLGDGTSFLLTCLSPSEPEALFCFQIIFEVLGYFANLPIALPAYSLFRPTFLSQFLLTHRYGVWNLDWESPLLSESIAAFSSAQNWVESLAFLGKRQGLYHL